MECLLSNCAFEGADSKRCEILEYSMYLAGARAKPDQSAPRETRGREFGRSSL